MPKSRTASSIVDTSGGYRLLQSARRLHCRRVRMSANWCATVVYIVNKAIWVPSAVKSHVLLHRLSGCYHRQFSCILFHFLYISIRFQHARQRACVVLRSLRCVPLWTWLKWLSTPCTFWRNAASSRRHPISPLADDRSAAWLQSL